MRSRRPRTALTLVGMGVVLLAAVLVGQQIGEHTIFGATERRVVIPEQVLTPVPAETSSNEAVARDWKRLQVVSVATDPAFPDPRVTPLPPPTPRPTPSPKPTPTPNPAGLYTSPPLPLPLISGETPPPDVAR
jgi:hypothetical protein